MTSPLLITVTIERETDSPLGLTLNSNEKIGKILVESIDSRGPFFGSPLRLDMELIAINNVNCANLTVDQATNLLKKETLVTVLAAQAESLPEGSITTVTLLKPSVDSKVGLRLRNVEGHEGLYVAEVRDGTLASTSKLRPGMLIVKINNIDGTSMTNTDAAELMKDTEGPLTFLTYTPLTGSGPANMGFSKYITVTVDADLSNPSPSIEDVETSKKEKNDDDKLEEANDEEKKEEAENVEAEKKSNIGLKLSQNADGQVMIDRVDPEGPFFKTPLRAGLEVLQINGIVCTSVEDAMTRLQANVSHTILAYKSDNRFAPGTVLSAVLTKETLDTKLGIRFGMGRETTIIKDIKDGSPAAKTDLDVGMIVHSINNTLCACLSPADVTKMLAEEEGTITILAEVPAQDTILNAMSFVTATMKKEKGSESKIGMTFSRREGGIYITGISSGSLADSTDLAVGMEVFSINNVELADEKASTAATLLSATDGDLTIVAKSPSLPAGSLVTAAMRRESIDEKWGAKIGYAGDVLIIKGIYADSPAAHTDLEAGMIVRSINNIDARTMKPADVAEIFAAESQKMTILAETTEDMTHMVCPSHIKSVRSLRGLVPAPPAPEPVEEEEVEEPEIAVEDDAQSELTNENNEAEDMEKEIARLRAMNAALKAKLAATGGKNVNTATATTTKSPLILKCDPTDPESSSDEDTVPPSYPVEDKVKGERLSWSTSEGMHSGIVINVVEC